MSEITRRNLVVGTTALACSTVSTNLLATTRDKNFHGEVARRARTLASAPLPQLRLLVPEGCEANLAPIIGAFKELTEIDVTLREVQVDEINAQLTLDTMRGKTDYDIALPATFGLPDLVQADVIRDLTDFAERHEPDGFRDGILYSIGDTFDARTYGFQTDGDTYVMFYHADWLRNADEQARYADRHGNPLDVPTTWEELDTQMAFFHRPDEERYGGALFRTPGYLAWEWWIRFHAKGIWPLSDELEPQIASEAGVIALEDMIRATESLYPHSRSANLFDNWKHFGEGNIFCNIGWGGSQKYLNGPRSKIRGRMVFSETPSGAPGSKQISIPYFNWGWTYVVTTMSQNPEIAYLFALFASTSEMSTRAVREADGYFDPFRPEHYDDPKIVETYSRDFLDVHERSLRRSIPDLYLANQGDYFRVLNEALNAAVNEGEDPETALKRAATEWRLLNLRSGKSAQLRRWRELRSKYPDTVRNALRDI